MATGTLFIKSIGKVTLSGNKRSKRIKISIKPDKSILVSFPFYVPVKEVLKAIEKDESWIKEQQQSLLNKELLISDGLVLNTKCHKICFYKGDVDDVVVKKKTVTVILKDPDSGQSRDLVNRLLTKIYRYEAMNTLPERLKRLAGKYGFSYNNVTIRNNRSNWGSCSSKNNISLNLQMMKLPDELIDYILLHELVHTRIKDHSLQFWQKLDQVTGGKAKELAKEVKKYSTYSFSNELV